MNSTTAQKPSLRTETFKGLQIIFREDGWINMTKAAHHYSKRPAKFLELPGTAEYMQALADALKVRKSDIAVSKRGGAKGNAGTWCHPKMAVRFARWLDVEFEVWCDLMIDNILRGNIQTTVVVPTKEAVAVSSAEAELRAQVLSLTSENEALKTVMKGEVPDGWLTPRCFLEDKGIPFSALYGFSRDLGALASSEMKRLKISSVAMNSKKGSVKADTTYYHPDALEAGYQKLKAAQPAMVQAIMP